MEKQDGDNQDARVTLTGGDSPTNPPKGFHDLLRQPQEQINELFKTQQQTNYAFNSPSSIARSASFPSPSPVASNASSSFPSSPTDSDLSAALSSAHQESRLLSEKIESARLQNKLRTTPGCWPDWLDEPDLQHTNLASYTKSTAASWRFATAVAFGFFAIGFFLGNYLYQCDGMVAAAEASSSPIAHQNDHIWNVRVETCILACDPNADRAGIGRAVDNATSLPTTPQAWLQAVDLDMIALELYVQTIAPAFIAHHQDLITTCKQHNNALAQSLEEFRVRVQQLVDEFPEPLPSSARHSLVARIFSSDLTLLDNQATLGRSLYLARKLDALLLVPLAHSVRAAQKQHQMLLNATLHPSYSLSTDDQLLSPLALGMQVKIAQISIALRETMTIKQRIQSSVDLFSNATAHFEDGRLLSATIKNDLDIFGAAWGVSGL